MSLAFVRQSFDVTPPKSFLSIIIIIHTMRIVMH